MWATDMTTLHPRRLGVTRLVVTSVAVAVAIACAKGADSEVDTPYADATACAPVARAEMRPGFAWWIDALFTPVDTILFGVHVRMFSADWTRASALSLDMLPREAHDDLSTLADSTRASFAHVGDFNSDGVSDRAVTGVYETAGCVRGRFLAILSPAQSPTPEVAYLVQSPGRPGFGVLWHVPGVLSWQSCMECDDLNYLVWNGDSYDLHHAGPGDEDEVPAPTDTVPPAT